MHGRVLSHLGCTHSRTGISIRNNTILSGSECLESNLSELSFDKWPQEAEVERCIEAGASGALSSDPVLWVRVFTCLPWPALRSRRHRRRSATRSRDRRRRRYRHRRRSEDRGRDRRRLEKKKRLVTTQESSIKQLEACVHAEMIT